jgi:hypothetical protein
MARWCTLIELDALSALLMRLPCNLVATVAQLHLGLLSRYDRATLFDCRGRKLSGEFHNRGAIQEATSQFRLALASMTSVDAPDGVPELPGYEPPFTSLDRWALFEAAYWDFVDRFGLEPPDSAERPE